MNIARIGYACKYMLVPDDIKMSKAEKEETKRLNTSSSTVSWMNRQDKQTAEDKLWEIAKHNLSSIRQQLEKLAGLGVELRMTRISSDILPFYTEPTWGYFWQKPDVVDFCAREFAKIGDYARANDIRLSFHPGQFCCIVSDSEDVVTRSLAELEYHRDMAVMMGYGKQKLDFKINVHLSGRLGIDGFITAFDRMSNELRRMLTIENDEYQAGLDDILPLSKHVGIVLDIHHHFINCGEYIKANDMRICQIKDSWQGVRPTFHYSQSQWEYLQHFSTKPTLDELCKITNKSKLRAHSTFYTHVDTNKWAIEHLEWGDCMAEAKAKNLASMHLYNSMITGIR